MKIFLTMLSLVFFSLNAPAAEKKRVDVIKEVFKYNKDSKRSIELSELNQGCPAVDCIPAIDKPQFASIDKIDFLHDDDIMMTVDYNGVQKSYPRKIMQTHEIVNDHFGKKPLAMTYCPLCGTSVAFVPIIDGERVEFGVSGVLHNSDLVMYDRKTKSLWGQITGRAIVGPKTGDRLKRVSVGLLTWKELKAEFPKSQILLPPTDKHERYKNFNYQKYTESEKIMFPVAVEDARLAAKQVVYGIEVDGQYIAFEDAYLKKRSPMVESFGKRTLMVTYKGGKVSAVDKKTGDQFDVLRVYWFAWFAFHPETQLRN
jgi:hypothetical protein